MQAGLKTRRASDKKPESSSIEIVSLQTLDSGPVSFAVRYWTGLRGARNFPPRNELSPRDMAPFLRNIVLLRVIDGGSDYEYRIVGDAFVQAFGADFRGTRLSAVEITNPDYGRAARATYEHVRVTGHPFALRGVVSPSTPSLFSYHETAFLPLGTEATVDHLLVATAFTPRLPNPEDTRTPADILDDVLPDSWKGFAQL